MGLSELQQVNAVIGLSKDITGWPSTLADHKYTLDRIELKLTIPDPVRPGSNKVINPDLLFVSDERNYSLLVELKKGTYNNRALEQCQNMAEVTPIQLVRNGRVTLASTANLVTHKTSTMLVVNEEHAEEFVNAFTAAACDSCAVSIGPLAIQTKYGNLIDSLLDGEFKRGVSIEKRYLPSRLVRVLPTTNETKDLKRCVVETVRDLWVNNERAVNAMVIAERLFRDGIWKLFDSDAQKQFLGVAKRVLKDMHQTEFNRYLQRVPSTLDEWTLLRLPESEGKTKLRAAVAFQNAVRSYKNRLLHDIEYSGRHIDQLTLDDILNGPIT